MQISETYRGSMIEVHTSVLASGRVSFVVSVDGEVVDVDIDGRDPCITADVAMHRARRRIDARQGSQ